MTDDVSGQTNQAQHPYTTRCAPTMLTANTAVTRRFGASPCSLGAHHSRSVLRPPRSLVVVRFQEPERSKAEKVTRDQEQQLADSAATCDKASSVEGRSAVRKTRDAIDALLGHRDASDSSSASSSTTTPAKRSAPGSVTPAPAFQAPLSLPVFSRRREVRCLQGLGSNARHQLRVMRCPTLVPPPAGVCGARGDGGLPSNLPVGGTTWAVRAPGVQCRWRRLSTCICCTHTPPHRGHLRVPPCLVCCCQAVTRVGPMSQLSISTGQSARCRETLSAECHADCMPL
jgi:hypothetical protein